MNETSLFIYPKRAILREIIMITYLLKTLKVTLIT